MSYYNYGTSVWSPSVYLSIEKIKVDIAISFVNGFKDKYDVKDERNRASMFFQTERGWYSFFRITNNRGAGGRIWIHRVEIYGGTSNKLSDLSLLYVENINKQGTIKITNGSQERWGFDWSLSEHTDGTELYFKTPGTVRFYAYIKWSDKNDKIYYQWFPVYIQAISGSTEKPITVYAPELLTLSNYGELKTTFYKNEPFSLGNVTILATYRYVVDGSNLDPVVVTNYKTTILQGTKLTTAEKNKKITISVSYNGTTKSLEYAINVYGVASYSKPIFPTYIKQGQSVDGLLTDTVFTYEDGTTSNFTTALRTALDTSVPGFVNITYQAYATKTEEYFYWDELDYEEIKS